MRFAFVAASIGLLVPCLAQAQLQGEQRDWQICANASRAFAPARQSQSCSALIEAGGLSAAMLGFALYNRGNASLSLGDYVRAVEDYDHSIEADPTDANAFKARCWALSIIGRLDEALADCSAALALQPGEDDILESRGLIYLRKSQWQNAARDFDAALQLNPNLPGSLFGRGVARSRLGDTEMGQADVMAARAMRHDIDAQFAKFGLQP
jgi:tetratricopeptide (TPR) repeat protein